MLAVTAASAVVQHNQQNKAIEAQYDQQNKQTIAGYAADQEQSRAADEQAFEDRTDRARQAQRQLAMARVAAAEGRGSLASMAINITGAEADDMSRIDASLANTKSSIRSRDAALVSGAADAQQTLGLQAQASNVQFGTTLAQGAASAAGSYYSNTQQAKLAQNLRPTQ